MRTQYKSIGALLVTALCGLLEMACVGRATGATSEDISPTEQAPMCPPDSRREWLHGSSGLALPGSKAVTVVHGATVLSPGSCIYYARASLGGDFRSRGIVLLLHGRDDDISSFAKVIEPLLDAGYKVLVPNFSWGGPGRDHVNWTRRDAMLDGGPRDPRLEARQVLAHAQGHGLGRDCVDSSDVCRSRYVIWAVDEATEFARDFLISADGTDAVDLLILDSHAAVPSIDDARVLLLASDRDADDRVSPSSGQWDAILDALDRPSS